MCFPTDSDRKTQGSQVLDTLFKAHGIESLRTQHLNSLHSKNAVGAAAIGHHLLSAGYSVQLARETGED